MASGRKKTKDEAITAQQPVILPLIYEGNLGTKGAVVRVPPPINQARAIAIRQNDGNVVVCSSRQ